MDDSAFTPDEPIDSPDQEANEARLQAELHKYQEAFRQEWEDGVKYEEGKLTGLEIREKSQELLTQATPKAIATMLYLSQHAKNESVRLKAATDILDRSIGKDVGKLVGDPLEALLQAINRKPAHSE